MSESKQKFINDDSPDFDDYENQLFPVYDDDQPKPTKVRWLILLLSFFGVMCAYVTRYVTKIDSLQDRIKAFANLIVS